MMNQRRTLCEDLPAELFGMIFKYLAPHDLLRAFTKLNGRLESLVDHQPLTLPNNRSMSFELYCDYLIKIVARRISQMVYVHLSERHGPYAVRKFICAMPLDCEFWPALRAVTLEDVPQHVIEALLIDSSFLWQVQSLTLDMSHQQNPDDEYEGYDDFYTVFSILSSSPQLRSLQVHLHHQLITDHSARFDERYFPMNIHQNLQILSIKQCSGELLVGLLNNGRLPQLRRLHASISWQVFKSSSSRVTCLCCSSACHADMSIDSPSPIPLQQAYAPELRHVNIALFAGGVTWLLTFFEDLQRHHQLEYFKLSGHVRFMNQNHFPRVTCLEQWVTLNKSNVFRFRMKLSVGCDLDTQSVREEVFEEYRRATGDEEAVRGMEINIRLPEMSFSYPATMNETSSSSNSDESSSNESIEMDDDDDDDGCSSKVNQWCRGEPLNENIEEFPMREDDYAHNGLFRDVKQISCWHRLKRIIIERHVLAGVSYVVGRKLDRLAHLIQCAPQLRELFIEHDLDYARALSSNVQLGILLASKLDVFSCTITEGYNSSLGDLARLIDTLFSHSTTTPRLKELTLGINEHPRTWLSREHLIQWISELIKRFPAMIHFTLCCEPMEAYQSGQYSLSRLLENKSLFSLLTNEFKHVQSNIDRKHIHSRFVCRSLVFQHQIKHEPIESKSILFSLSSCSHTFAHFDRDDIRCVSHCPMQFSNLGVKVTISLFYSHPYLLILE